MATKLKTPCKAWPIKRMCVICGSWININVATDHTYNTGHYFKGLNLPFKTPDKTTQNEYWECDKCFLDMIPEEDLPIPVDLKLPGRKTI